MNRRIVQAIAEKDIEDALKNLTILFAVLLPVGLSLMFGFLFSSNSADLVLTVSMFDPEGSALAQQLRSDSDLALVEEASPEEVRLAVTGDVVGGLVIPPGFDADVAAGQRPEVQVYVNSRSGGGAVVAFQGIVEENVWALAGQSMPARIVVGATAEGTEQAASGFNPGPNLLAMLLIMALAMAGAFVVPTMVVEEKERKTLLAVQVSPASTADIVAGKALAGLFYALISVLLILTLNDGWQGQWPVTLATVVLGAVFIILVGLLMGSLFGTTSQVNTWSSIVLLILLVPSWAEMFQLPSSLNAVFRLIPTYYMDRLIVLAVQGQASAGEILLGLGALAVAVVITFGVVMWVLRREAAPSERTFRLPSLRPVASGSGDEGVESTFSRPGPT